MKNENSLRLGGLRGPRGRKEWDARTGRVPEVGAEPEWTLYPFGKSIYWRVVKSANVFKKKTHLTERRTASLWKPTDCRDFGKEKKLTS